MTSHPGLFYLNKTENMVHNYNSAKLAETQEECPRKREWTDSSGEVRNTPCGQRTCICCNCREYWSNKQWLLLLIYHRHCPFTHKLRLTPPRPLSNAEKVNWVRQLLNSLKVWLFRHPDEQFEGALYPDLHGRSTLHWNAVIRCSKGAELQFRKLMKSRRVNEQCSYSLTLFKDFNSQSAYAVGRLQQHFMKVIKIEGKRAILTIGHPFFMSKSLLWNLRREGKRMGVSV